MSLSGECRKMKRTGFWVAFAVGGLLAAAVPVLNTAFRTELYVVQAEEMTRSPARILLDANWQMMAMLNLLFTAAGACMLYDVEYSGRAMEKMRMLPVRESGIFWGKCVILAGALLVMTVLEAAALSFCRAHWLAEAGAVWEELGLAAEQTGGGQGMLRAWLAELIGRLPSGRDLWLWMAYLYILHFPAAVMALLIASAFRNMWVSLGILVVCIALAAAVSAGNQALSMFPYVLPMRLPSGNGWGQNLAAAAAETLLFGAAENVLVRVRRWAA